MSNGWIRLHRKLLENPYMGRPAYRSLWVELLLNAAHGEYETFFKGKRITLKPGQLTTGAKILARNTGVSRGTVEGILRCFKNEEQIEVQPSNKCSLITIKNWHLYQTNEERNEEQVRSKRGANEEQMRSKQRGANEEQVRSKRGANEEQMRTKQEDKEDKEDKEKLFTRFWKIYPRKEGKKSALKKFEVALRETTFKKIIATLEQQIKSEQWQNPKFIPHPTTWLNQGRWDDEPVVDPATRQPGERLDQWALRTGKVIF